MAKSAAAVPQLELEPSSSSEEVEGGGGGGGMSIGNSASSFDRERHLTYLRMMYQMIPYHYQSQEINRITLAYFAISGLDIIGALDTVDRDEVASWVLSLRAQPRDVSEINNGMVLIVNVEHVAGEFYGFNGSRSSQFPSGNSRGFSGNHSHLASTYCALAILKTVRHNLFNIDWTPLLMSMRNLQQPDGSFLPIHFGAETDLRFTYCAAAICFMLDNWSGMDRDKATEYILKCKVVTFCLFVHL
ncbi:Geranylgeranyl transferase type-1 subunit beta [Linum perenne]